MDAEHPRGHPGRRTILMGLLYAGFATIILYFLFWALTDSHAYFVHAFLLGGIVFLISVLAGWQANRDGKAQQARAESMKIDGRQRPTSEMRWENRPM